MSKRSLLVPIVLASSLVGCLVGVLLLWLAGREMTATMISLAEEEGNSPYLPCHWSRGELAAAHRVVAWWSTWTCMDCGALVQVPGLDSQLGCNQQAGGNPCNLCRGYDYSLPIGVDAHCPHCRHAVEQDGRCLTCCRNDNQQGA